MSNPLQHFVWLDLETTGLDPASEQILAVGIILTDTNLREIARFEQVAQALDEEVLANMAPIVRDMHTRSGLLERVQASQLTLSDVERNGAEFLLRHMGPGNVGVLAGNTVHFDRSFLREWAPALLCQVSHRHLDVSTLKVIAQAWCPGKAAPQINRTPAHMPLLDLEHSMREFAFWRALLFREGIGPEVSAL